MFNVSTLIVFVLQPKTTFRYSCYGKTSSNSFLFNESLHSSYTKDWESTHLSKTFIQRRYPFLKLEKPLIGPSSPSLILGQTPKPLDTNYQHKKSGNDQRLRKGSDLSLVLSERRPWVWVSIPEDCSFHWQSWLLRRAVAGLYQ